jgi:hypothetical protein
MVCSVQPIEKMETMDLMEEEGVLDYVELLVNQGAEIIRDLISSEQIPKR